MTAPLYKHDFLEVDHRLIWWLLARQRDAEGESTGLVGSGWRASAMRDLDIGRTTLWKSLRRLYAAGVIAPPKYRRSLRLNEEAFQK